MKDNCCFLCNKSPGRKKYWNKRVQEGKEEVFKKICGKQWVNSKKLCDSCYQKFYRWLQKTNIQEFKDVQTSNQIVGI
jgi:hypothetical protein